MQGKLGICLQENVLDLYLKPFHLVQKINSKHIKDLNITAKTIKFLPKNREAGGSFMTLDLVMIS